MAEDSKKLAEEFKDQANVEKDRQERIAKTLEEIAPILKKYDTVLTIKQNIVVEAIPHNREERRK